MGNGPCRTPIAVRDIAIQRSVLAQHDAVAAEEEIAQAKTRYTALIGAGEWPDNLQQEE